MSGEENDDTVPETGEEVYPPIVEAMEQWLASPEFERTLKKEYDDACRGNGRSDRNISETVFMETTIALFEHMPETMQLVCPEPDIEFIDSAIEPLLGGNLRKSGIEDLEQFELGVNTVYIQLAACATLMVEQLMLPPPSIAQGAKSRADEKINAHLHAAGL